MSFTHPFDFLTNEGYQLSQSLMAFGSGGWFGMGLGKGRQKYAFLPYPESDFIFAVVGEDLGFVGCCGVLCLFCAFVFFGLRVAMRCRDRFGSLLAGGITAMIGVQCVMNVMVVTGMMPHHRPAAAVFLLRRHLRRHCAVRRGGAFEHFQGRALMNSGGLCAKNFYCPGRAAGAGDIGRFSG